MIPSAYWQRGNHTIKPNFITSTFGFSFDVVVVVFDAFAVADVVLFFVCYFLFFRMYRTQNV